MANLYSIIRYQRTDNALSDKSKIIILRSDLQVEAEAARRLAICRRCPLHKVTLGVERCGQCGCPLSGLTRQNSKTCPQWQ